MIGKEHLFTELEPERTVKLHLGLIKDINLNLYPPHRVHYLIYALLHGLKLPSVQAMDRSDIRNSKKAGAERAAKVIKRPGRTLASVPLKVRRMFVLPEKVGSPPIVMPVRRARGARKVVYSKQPAYRKGRVFPPRKPISLPNGLLRNNKTNKTLKVRKEVFQVRSPTEIALKAERERFREEVEKFRKKSVNSPQNAKKGMPEYFRKRKANQQRRRKEKHELIKSNRNALV